MEVGGEQASGGGRVKRRALAVLPCLLPWWVQVPERGRERLHEGGSGPTDWALTDSTQTARLETTPHRVDHLTKTQGGKPDDTANGGLGPQIYGTNYGRILGGGRTPRPMGRRRGEGKNTPPMERETGQMHRRMDLSTMEGGQTPPYRKAGNCRKLSLPGNMYRCERSMVTSLTTTMGDI